ncbi:MAG: dockerin type I domain-containing protein [bacterium]|nr:dockerin type I domain-containing protein [bacterium]
MKKVLCLILILSLIVVQVFSIPGIAVEDDLEISSYSGVCAVKGVGSSVDEDDIEYVDAPLGSSDRVGGINEYYYNNLLKNGYQKALYNGLLNALDSNNEDVVKPQICFVFNFRNTNITQQEQLDRFLEDLEINNVWNAFVYDQPQLFWISTCEMLLTSDGRDCYVFVLVGAIDEYIDSPDKLLEDYRAFDSNVKAVVDGAPTESDYDKLLYFNNHLINNNEYNESVDPNQDVFHLPHCAASAVLSEYSPVCQGYASAFKLFCDLSGIECIEVYGFGKNSQNASGQAHAWNYVNLNGAWYAVDVTWNDSPDINRQLRYFLIGSETIVEPLWTGLEKFGQTHILSAINEDGNFYPRLSTVEYNALGDINYDGHINSADVIHLARYLANWTEYRTLDEELSDVNRDGAVDPLDVMILARYVAGWEGYKTLPYVS